MASSYSMSSKTQTEAKQGKPLAAFKPATPKFKSHPAFTAEEKRVVERRRAALVLCIRSLPATAMRSVLL
jgi:hypothetical protein